MLCAFVPLVIVKLKRIKIALQYYIIGRAIKPLLGIKGASRLLKKAFSSHKFYLREKHRMVHLSNQM